MREPLVLELENGLEDKVQVVALTGDILQCEWVFGCAEAATKSDRRFGVLCNEHYDRLMHAVRQVKS